jgi:hypothetical protein
MIAHQKYTNWFEIAMDNWRIMRVKIDSTFGSATQLLVVQLEISN